VLLVQGGSQIGSLTLTRFFAIHIWIVPLILLSIVGIHLYLVIIHGVTSKAEHRQPVKTAEEQKKVYKASAHSEEKGEWFHPETIVKTYRRSFGKFSGKHGGMDNESLALFRRDCNA
jgi:ubiquinol-cytochrome c reductase cytochrome b subunit